MEKIKINVDLNEINPLDKPLRLLRKENKSNLRKIYFDWVKL